MKNDVVILSGARSAVGAYGGSLKTTTPCDMAAKVIEEALRRAEVAPELVGQVVMGNVIHSEPRDMYIARVAALNAGIPNSVPALTVNRLCGSGLQAVVTAAQQIQLGLVDAVVAGGAESMSRAPYHLPTARFGQRMGNGQTVDPVVSALTCPFNDIHMGVTAENVAREFNISREDQDEYALRSHERAKHAINAGYFNRQIMPITIKSRKADVEFKQDEHVRFDVSLASMQSLKPAFQKEGSVTAGNSSGLNDGAAALVMMSREVAESKGYKSMARILDYSIHGVDPKIMGIGPVPVIRQILSRQNLGVDDIDIYEINEAFASQALAVCRELSLPMGKVNPNGSGIALGHPVGATGAILVVKAIYELERIKGRYAVISLCIGGGQGIALLIERN